MTKKCPSCGGGGSNGITGDCSKCGGSGEVEDDKKRDWEGFKITCCGHQMILGFGSVLSHNTPFQADCNRCGKSIFINDDKGAAVLDERKVKPSIADGDKFDPKKETMDEFKKRAKRVLGIPEKVKPSVSEFHPWCGASDAFFEDCVKCSCNGCVHKVREERPEDDLPKSLDDAVTKGLFKTLSPRALGCVYEGDRVKFVGYLQEHVILKSVILSRIRELEDEQRELAEKGAILRRTEPLGIRYTKLTAKIEVLRGLLPKKK